MANPETQTTLVTKKQNEDNNKNTQRVKRVNNTGVNRGVRERQVDINIHLNVRLPFSSVTYS